MSERLVLHRVEPQPFVARSQHLPQHRVRLARDHRLASAADTLSGDVAADPTQWELALAGIEPLAGYRHQRRELCLVVRRTDVLEHDVTAITALRDLDLRRPDRPGDFRTNTTTTDRTGQRGVSISTPATT